MTAMSLLELDLFLRMDRAVRLGIKYGGIDGVHHKQWVIDQMLRILAGEGYEQLIKDAKDGEDGPDTYDWDEGIPP